MLLPVLCKSSRETIRQPPGENETGNVLSSNAMRELLTPFSQTEPILNSPTCVKTVVRSITFPKLLFLSRGLKNT